MAIEITLTAYNMGAVTEGDFDAWAAFVAENIDAAVGLEVAAVSQSPFASGPDHDVITGGTAQDREYVRTWLSVDGWARFCSGVPAVSFEAARAWAREAVDSEYLIEYADAPRGADPGSRCGLADDELDEIRRILAKRDLRLMADDLGLRAQRAV